MVDLLAEAHDLPPETVFPPDWDLFYVEYSKLMTSFLPISGRPMGFSNMSVGHQKFPMSDQMFVARRENGSRGPFSRKAV